MKVDRVFNRKAYIGWWGYPLAAGLVALATLVGYVAHPFLSPTNIVMLYLLCVVFTAVLWGLGPSILACVLSVLTHDFFFIKPILSFGPPDIQDIPTLLVLLVVGAMTSYLTSMVRRQTEEATRREHETYILYILSRNLATTDELGASVSAIMKSAKEMLGYDVSIFLPDVQNKKKLKLYAGGIEPNLGEDGITAATWSFQERKRAGQGTNIFPSAKAQYVPLITGRGAVGVMSLSVDGANRLTIQQERLLGAFADIAAVAIERIVFAEEARTSQISLAATEKLQTSLLDSVSHDLRTPLSSVIGVLSSLQEELELDDAARKNLIQVARGAAERLNHSITNLLDVSRIQAGTIRVAKEPCDVNDIISVALDQMSDYSIGRTINVDVAPELPFVSADFGLMVKVLCNLIDNAVKYSPSNAPIEIRAWQITQEVEIEVTDRGMGIPPQELPFIFQRFHRVPHTGVAGIGLGLSICKGIVEAHGGHITVENRHGGGTIIRLTLPVAEETAESQAR